MTRSGCNSFACFAGIRARPLLQTSTSSTMPVIPPDQPISAFATMRGCRLRACIEMRRSFCCSPADPRRIPILVSAGLATVPGPPVTCYVSRSAEMIKLKVSTGGERA